MATTPEEMKALDLEKQQAVADRDAKIQQVHNDKEKMAEMDYALNFPILMASNAITFEDSLLMDLHQKEWLRLWKKNTN